MLDKKLSKVDQAELAQINADFDFWKSIFNHMPGWKVCGCTFRNTCMVVDNFGKAHHYTFEALRPIMALKGISQEKPNFQT